MTCNGLPIRVGKIQNPDMIAANIDKDGQQLELSFIICENAHGISALEDILTLLYKAKHNLIIWSRNYAFIQWVESMSTQNLHINVFNSFSHHP